MFRIPVSSKLVHQKAWVRANSSSSFIRNSFIDYFVNNHGHKHVKSSSVVPLCDPSVPFVNAGMNQFKGVFLGRVEPPCPRAVNSQKCVRVGGKHNDLDVVGVDGHHHTFFEMLGNWSFGDYYKKEACQMAWDLLLGPYRLKPENLLVTYFSGDVILNLTEDRECRDIWKEIGVPASHLRAQNAADNFWEMGATGPCGPCTEIHHINPDGSLTEIWNIVFIQCNRQSDGSVTGLRRQHVDTGMGLERMAALLQAVPSNYDTDLFRPIISAIEKNSVGVPEYSSRYGADASLDAAYRRLADHARMISVCLADGVFPANSLNLKQILRKSFKMSSEIFQNKNLLFTLYDEVAATLGAAYPELISKEKDAKLILAHEQDSYDRLKSNMAKKWKDLVRQYPEVEAFSDVEMAGFAQGYKEFKETMSKQTTNVMPGELVFKLYDTHGFQEDIIERIAKQNNLDIDKKTFWKLLAQHKAKHKTALKEQSSNKGLLFDKAIEKLVKKRYKSTNDLPKYDYANKSGKITFPSLRTKLVAILNEDITWIDCLDPAENKPYYLVTESTNFYCEEGGQASDSGVIRLKEGVTFNVDNAFKIRDFVFHKGYFHIHPKCVKPYVLCDDEVEMSIDSEKRLNIMKNHTAVHLLNAAIRKALPNSVVCQIGSSVTDKGLSLNLSVYGEKLSPKVVKEAEELVRKSISSNVWLELRVLDSVGLSQEPDVVTVPGEAYPETGLRLVTMSGPLPSRELCCGTHVPSTGELGDFLITLVKGAGGNAPNIHAITGHAAAEAREQFCRAEKLQQVLELVSPERKDEELNCIKQQLVRICGSSGAPQGEYAQCLALIDSIKKTEVNKTELALQAVAEEEVREVLAEASHSRRRFVVHFLRCSYLMQAADLRRALQPPPAAPALMLGCAGGTIIAACHVPRELVTDSFTATSWLTCVLPVFQAQLEPTDCATYAEMTATKVSLITCEQMVQDAMRVAIKFAQSHAQRWDSGDSGEPSKDRRQN
ncbi:alanine--tRNA ligase, mitochondrial [Pectinophora gossypiella]|uniref:alanine--tRNA ligase, mitochondrial n=1 Tax=Pectinophora gossypiella TaxID=13191 RepID=UPI00214E2340|nr:alanine--tRNA ligase, mitochondrial [Pectinophora gossypiella]